MSTYEPDRKCFRVPLDARIIIGSIWLAAFTLVGVDTLDGTRSLLSTWGILLAIAGIGTMKWYLDAYSRRVIFEVMTWEHRQLREERLRLAALELAADADDDADAPRASVSVIGGLDARPGG